MKKLLCLGIALCVIACSPDNINDDSIYQEDSIIELKESALFELANEYRISNGLNALADSPDIYHIAEQHTLFMIKEHNLSHDGFQQRATKIAGLTNAKHVGEIVAYNFSKPEQALKGWLNSADHKKTLEGEFTHTTVCVKESKNGTLFYTQLFLKK